MDNDIVRFTRRKDFQLKDALGRGACGETVLLYDPQIDEHYVCKKYSPLPHVDRQAYYQNFVREVKLLHALHHRNVVRVYNNYLYPERHAGYILMEYIKGRTVDQYAKQHPDAMSSVFEQFIDGFSYLESNNVLHRDVRPGNLLVGDDGVSKIIDFGFGKKAINTADFDKSISLNWWCAPPPEFASGTYDFCTEVYFVGMLFQQILSDGWLVEFKHEDILKRMCQQNRNQRARSFSDVKKELLTSVVELEFTPEELDVYREFSSALAGTFAKIQTSSRYITDPEIILTKLETYFRRVMLEQYVPDVVEICRSFVQGEYTYFKRSDFPVGVLKAFVHLLKSSSPEKRSAIVSNIHSRLDAIERKEPKKEGDIDDDIPF